MRASRLLLVGLAVAVTSASALAQSRIDRAFTTVSKSCDGIQWSQETLTEFPNIASACQSVEEREGRTYVKFKGEVERNRNSGREVTVNFQGGSTMTLTPPENTQVFVDGRRTPVRNLRPGDELNFYVPETRLVAEVAQDESPQPRFVVVPIVVHHQAQAQNETPERTASTALPATGSDVPLGALGGFVLLSLGAALSLRRMRRH